MLLDQIADANVSSKYRVLFKQRLGSASDNLMRLALSCFVDALDSREAFVAIACKCAMKYSLFDMLRELDTNVLF